MNTLMSTYIATAAAQQHRSVMTDAGRRSRFGRRVNSDRPALVQPISLGGTILSFPDSGVAGEQADRASVVTATGHASARVA